MRKRHNGVSQIAFIIALFLALIVLSIVGFWVRQMLLNHAKALSQQQLSRQSSKQIQPEATIPQNFPKDFPIYPGALVTSSLSDIQLGPGIDAWLSLETKDIGSSVLSFYTKALTDTGWLNSSTQKTSQGAILRVTKGGKLATLSIEASKEQKKTNILIVIGPAKLTP